MVNDWNVLLLTVDSLRADAVSGAGRIAGDSTSPALTDFMEEALVFSRAYSHGPYTPCAMSSLFTSQYPRSALIPPRTLRPDRPTIAQLLQRSGYTTLGFHSNPLVSRAFDYDRGFEYFDESLLPGGTARIQDIAPWRVTYLLSKALRSLTKRVYLDAAAMNGKALRLMQSINQPWFMWIHYMDVHGPYQSHKRLNWLDEWRSKSLWRKASTQPERVTDRDFQRLLAGYREEIGYWDDQFGVLLNALDEMGLLESTIIIITSDHGDQFFEHGGFSHLRKLWGELLHIPLIIRIPARQGCTVSELVGHIDILPTILELVQAPLADHEFEGRSLLPLIDGTAAGLFDGRRLLADAAPDRAAALVAAWTTRWKYICDETENTEYLFDFEADPGEQHNVIDHVDPALIEPLRSKVTEYLSLAGDLGEEASVAEAAAAEVGDDVIRRLVALGYIEDAEQMRR